MGKINSRAKGAAGERELASYLREQGWQKARRSQQYAGNPEGGSGDVVCANFPFHIEGKRCQALKPEDWMAQAKRDAMPYPPHPSWREAVRRISAYDLATAKRVSACEEPGSEHGTGRGRSPWPRLWSLSGGPGSYVSGFGMAHSTYGIGARITGYPYPPEASPAQQLLVAVAGAHSFGWSGWGCY